MKNQSTILVVIGLLVLLGLSAGAGVKPGGGNAIGGFDALFNYNWLSVDSTGAASTLSTQATAPLYTYTFVAVSGTSTLTGYFVDTTGAQQSAQQSFSVTTGTNFTNLYDTANSITANTPLPSTFAGFKGALSGNALYEGNGSTNTGTLTYTPTGGFQIAVTPTLTIGRAF